ncbi:MAG: PBECR2 nuclease fold domain-containing protein [Acutalibacteraceae bacterium]
MHYIGKINREIYKCVTEDIITDEVIITEKQIEHIKERHPNDIERYYDYIKEIVENPDYILEANKPNTAFILKHIIDNGKNYQLILRLKTSDDPILYKNSVITFLRVDDRKWAKYLRNKKILYDKNSTIDNSV